MIEKSKLKDEKDKKQIEIEIKILKNTFHFNIIKLYEVIDKDTENFFENVIKHMKAFDMENIKLNYEKDINTYFNSIEEKYDGKGFFADTRELIKNQVTDLLENGIKNL